MFVTMSLQAVYVVIISTDIINIGIVDMMKDIN